MRTLYMEARIQLETELDREPSEAEVDDRVSDVLAQISDRLYEQSRDGKEFYMTLREQMADPQEWTFDRGRRQYLFATGQSTPWVEFQELAKNLTELTQPADENDQEDVAPETPDIPVDSKVGSDAAVNAEATAILSETPVVNDVQATAPVADVNKESEPEPPIPAS